MACHTQPLKKSEETRGNAITQPQSYPIPKFYIHFNGMLGNGISLFLHFFEGYQK